MRTWDIIDLLSPDVRITQIGQNQTPKGGVMTKTAQAIVLMGLVVATCGIPLSAKTADSGPMEIGRHVVAGARESFRAARVGEEVKAIPTLTSQIDFELALYDLPRSFNTPLASKAEEEMSDFEQNYPW